MGLIIGTCGPDGLGLVVLMDWTCGTDGLGLVVLIDWDLWY